MDLSAAHVPLSATHPPIAGPRTFPAPMRGMGPARRRSFARVADGQLIVGPDGVRAALVGVVGVIVLVLALAVGGCVSARPAALAPIDVAVRGALLDSTVAGGPLIECRGLGHDRCLAAGSIEGPIGGVPPGGIARVVVGCAAEPCTSVEGSVRVDIVLLDGSTQVVASGGYVTTADLAGS